MDDDSKLVARVLRGERAAFDTLVTRYHDAVYRQALRRVGNPQDAEEVTQNSFLKAYLRLEHLRRADEFPGWLRAITAHESASWMRRRAAARERSAQETEPLPDGALTPEQALMNEELRRVIHAALASLPDRERQVACAFYLEGSSYREIQQRYGLARSSVATYLYHARQRLASRLAGILPGIPWLPGLIAWWRSSISQVAGGSEPTQLARAAVAAVSVATVAAFAPVARPPSRPPPPAAGVRAASASRPARPADASVPAALPPAARAADLAAGTAVAASDEALAQVAHTPPHAKAEEPAARDQHRKRGDAEFPADAEQPRQRAEANPDDLCHRMEALQREIESRVHRREMDLKARIARAEARATQAAEIARGQYRSKDGKSIPEGGEGLPLNQHWDAIMAEAQGVMQQLDADLEPLFKQIGPLLEEVAYIHQQINQEEPVERGWPIVEQPGPLTEPSARLDRQSEQLNQNPRGEEHHQENEKEQPKSVYEKRG